MELLLVGTNHANQYVGNKYGDSAQFTEYLRSVCSTHEVDLLAEEMSIEALEKNSAKSTALELARTLGITHLFCDPNRRERTALGIPTDDELRTSLGFRKYLLNHQIDRFEDAERSYWPLREEEWIRRVEACSFSICLFIVGSNHVSSFSDIVRSRGMPLQVLHQRWMP